MNKRVRRRLSAFLALVTVTASLPVSGPVVSVRAETEILYEPQDPCFGS